MDFQEGTGGRLGGGFGAQSPSQTHPKGSVWLAGDGLLHYCVVASAGVRRFSCGKNEREARYGESNAQVHLAAVRSAKPNGFAKQTEKGD